jgi:hypothetical protein
MQHKRKNATCTSQDWRDILPIIQSAGLNLNQGSCFIILQKSHLLGGGKQGKNLAETGLLVCATPEQMAG